MYDFQTIFWWKLKNWQKSIWKRIRIWNFELKFFLEKSDGEIKLFAEKSEIEKNSQKISFWIGILPTRQILNWKPHNASKVEFNFLQSVIIWINGFTTGWFFKLLFFKAAVFDFEIFQKGWFWVYFSCIRPKFHPFFELGYVSTVFYCLEWVRSSICCVMIDYGSHNCNSRNDTCLDSIPIRVCSSIYLDKEWYPAMIHSRLKGFQSTEIGNVALLIHSWWQSSIW